MLGTAGHRGGLGMRPCLFILDDDVDVAELFSTIAQHAGLDARVFTKPTAFLDSVAARPPALALLDLIMPERDGLDVIEALAALPAPPPILLTSGLGGAALRAVARHAEARGLRALAEIEKPFRVRDARAALIEAAEAARSDRASARGASSPGVALQPIIACADGAVTGFEALARWADAAPTGPAIRAAEDAGRVGAVTTAVLAQALAAFAPLAAPGRSLSVNLSMLSLRNPRVCAEMTEACAEAGVDPSHVTVELTESSELDQPETAAPVLRALRDAGFGLALDDFGTGWAAIEHLARLPLTEIKIDRAFIRSAPDGAAPEDKILRALAGLGRALYLTVTAEGIESAAALAYVAEAGCHRAQGFHIGRPMTPAAVGRWLAAR